jgi:hypothetical protein
VTDLSLDTPLDTSPSEDILDQLLVEATPVTAVSRGVIQKVNYSHDAMIDMILAQPGISQNLLAAKFGYTPSWICQVLQSDAFQAKFAERRKEVVDPILMDSVEKGFEAMVRRSQEILMEKLNAPTHQIPDQLVLQALQVSSRAAGYGARDAAPASPKEVHNHLHILSENLVGLLHKRKAEAGFDNSPVAVQEASNG